MSAWRKDFHANIAEVDAHPKRFYNEYQTSIYCQKFPNRLYFDEESKKDYSGVKQMKDKNCITLMVGTLDSEKFPLAVFGKPKNPECFKLMDFPRPPLPYKTEQILGLIKKLYYGGF